MGIKFLVAALLQDRVCVRRTRGALRVQLLQNAVGLVFVPSQLRNSLPHWRLRSLWPWPLRHGPLRSSAVFSIPTITAMNAPRWALDAL